MAETAFQTMYRDEFVAGFEQNQSLVRDTTTTEFQSKGNEAVFLVADSGGASAVTRGVNGRIPGRPDNLNQLTATLAEWHDVVEKTNFNIFASQGNQRQIMQKTTMAVVNRKIDEDIIGELNAGTVNTGAAATASLMLSARAKTILQNSDVPWDSNIFSLITPAYEAYLLQIPEFSNAEYVDAKPIPGAAAAWSDRPKMYRWIGVNWIVHPNLPGKGTANEVCFMYHKSAIGHAVNTGGISTAVDYDSRHDLSWCRATIYMGPKLLQNSGVVKINHDGSAFAAA